MTNVDRASDLMTDGSISYRQVGTEFASHSYVDHRFEYVRDGVHSNTAENFFSILKRGVIGTYHHWSEAHIHRYLAEFDFRYSTKDISDRERADKALKARSASASPIGGLLRSPPDYFRLPKLFGERRKRWTRS